jgi:hypothetical protein
MAIAGLVMARGGNAMAKGGFGARKGKASCPKPIKGGKIHLTSFHLQESKEVTDVLCPNKIDSTLLVALLRYSPCFLSLGPK